MKNFENIQFLTLANTLVSLLTAFVLGSIVGFERQFRQRTAGPVSYTHLTLPTKA